MKPILVLQLIIATVKIAVAKYTEIYVSEPQKNWVYLDKFVFDTTGKGSISYKIQTYTNTTDGSVPSLCGSSLKGSGTLNLDCFQQASVAVSLLFYSDQERSTASWFSIYNDNTLTCEERLQRAHLKVPLDTGIVSQQVINLDPTVRPHFWFVVLAHCSERSLQATGFMHFLNSQAQDSLYNTAEFSFDEMGLLDMGFFFVSIYWVGALAAVPLARWLASSGALHELHWLLMGSYCFFAAAHLFFMIHYLQYSRDGMGFEGLAVTGRCAEVVGFVIYVNVVLLVGRGWTITTDKLSRTVEHAAVSGFILLVYLALFMAEWIRDPAQSFYLFDSWPGYLLVAMQLALLLGFWFLLRRTYVFEKRAAKRAFYLRAGVLFSLWFLQLPIFVAIAQHIMPWYLIKTLYGLEWTVQLVAFVLLPALVTSHAKEVFTRQNNYLQRIPSVARQLQVRPEVAGEFCYPTASLPSHDARPVPFAAAAAAAAAAGDGLWRGESGVRLVKADELAPEPGEAAGAAGLGVSRW